MRSGVVVLLTLIRTLIGNDAPIKNMCHQQKENLEMKRTEQEQPNQLRQAPIDLQEIDLQEAVRRRAYELFEQRGMQDGFEVEDWLQAESEVLDTQASRRAA
jgi:hypothetical protein